MLGDDGRRKGVGRCDERRNLVGVLCVHETRGNGNKTK